MSRRPWAAAAALLALPLGGLASEELAAGAAHHRHAVHHHHAHGHQRHAAATCRHSPPLVSLVLSGGRESLTKLVRQGPAQVLPEEALLRAPKACYDQWKDTEQCCTEDFFQQVGALHSDAMGRFDSIKDVYLHLVEDVLAPVAAALKTTAGTSQLEHVLRAIAFVKGQVETKASFSVLLQRHTRRHRRQLARRRQHGGSAALPDVGRAIAHYLDKCELGILGHFAAMTCKVCDPRLSDFLADRFMQVSLESTMELWASCQDAPRRLLQAAAQLKEAHNAMAKVTLSGELGVSEGPSGIAGLAKAKWWLGAAAQQVEAVASRISFYENEPHFRDRLARSGYAYLPEDWGYVVSMHPSQAANLRPTVKGKPCYNGMLRNGRCLCKPCWEGEACDIAAPEGPASPQAFAPLMRDSHVHLRVVGCRMPYDDNSQLARIRLLKKSSEPVVGDSCTKRLTFLQEDDLKYQVPVLAGERDLVYDIRQGVQELGAHVVCFCRGAQCWSEPDTWYRIGEVEIVKDEAEAKRAEAELWEGAGASWPAEAEKRRCPQEPLLEHDPSIVVTRSWAQATQQFSQATYFACAEGFRHLEGPRALRCAEGVWTVKEEAHPDDGEEGGGDKPAVDSEKAKDKDKDKDTGKVMGPADFAKDQGDDASLDEEGYRNVVWDGVLPFCYAERECNSSAFPEVKGFLRRLDNGIVTYQCEDNSKIIVIPGIGIPAKAGQMGMGERVRVKSSDNKTIVAHVLEDLGAQLRVREAEGFVLKTSIDWLTSKSSHSWPCHGHEAIELICDFPPEAFYEEVTTEAGRIAGIDGTKPRPVATETTTATPTGSGGSVVDSIGTAKGETLGGADLLETGHGAEHRGKAAAGAKHHAHAHSHHKRQKHHHKHGRHHRSEHKDPEHAATHGGSLLQLGESQGEAEMAEEVEDAAAEGAAAGFSFLELGSSTEGEVATAGAAGAAAAGAKTAAPAAPTSDHRGAGRVLVVLPKKPAKEVLQIRKYPVQFTSEPDGFAIDRCWSVNCTATDEELYGPGEDALAAEASVERLLQQEILAGIYDLSKLNSMRSFFFLFVTAFLMIFVGPGRVLGCVFCCRAGGCKPACCLGRAGKRREPVPPHFGLFAPGSGLCSEGPLAAAAAGAWPEQLTHQRGPQKVWVRPSRRG